MTFQFGLGIPGAVGLHTCQRAPSSAGRRTPAQHMLILKGSSEPDHGHSSTGSLLPAILTVFLAVCPLPPPHPSEAPTIRLENRISVVPTEVAQIQNVNQPAESWQGECMWGRGRGLPLLTWRSDYSSLPLLPTALTDTHTPALCPHLPPPSAPGSL